MRPLSLSNVNKSPQHILKNIERSSYLTPAEPISFLTKNEPLYDPWQSKLAIDVYRFLRKTGPKIDLVMNVSPAGGKSSPISKAWQNAVSDIHILQDIPKILWVCANKTLTFEKYNDFRKDVLDMLIKGMMNPTVNPFSPVKAEIKMTDGPKFQYPVINTFIPLQTFNYDISRNIEPRILNQLVSVVNNFVGYKMMGNQIPIKNSTISFSCTYSYAPEILKTFKANLIVIDELQERFQVDSNSGEMDDKITSLIETIQNAESNTSIIMLTGSMNISTCNNICSILNLKTNRNFRTESAAALNRSSLSIVPLTVTKNDALANLVLNQIQNRSTNNLIAIFSTDKIRNISDQIISKTPEFPPEIITGYKGPIQKSTLTPRTNIQSIGSDIKNEFSSPKWMYDHLSKMLKSNDENTKFLAKCLQHKFGYIFSPKNPDGSRADFDVNDVIIVQELFKLGKIYTVFATTMVGVGVNLSVNNLYLPSIEIYKGKNISQSDITQLINRAGRKADAFADIYCNPNDIQYILKALDELPGSHIPVIDIDEINKRMGGEFTIIDNQPVKLNSIDKLKHLLGKYSISMLKQLFKKSS